MNGSGLGREARLAAGEVVALADGAKRRGQSRIVALIGIDPVDWGIGARLADAGFDVVALPAGAAAERNDEPGVALVRCESTPVDRSHPLTVLTALPSGPAVIVVAGGSCGTHEIRDLLAAGARGVVAEAAIDHSLVPTIAAVLAGQVCIPAADAEALRQPVLSFREKQVLELAARGQTNAQIATQLFLAESTIKSHLYTAFRKLGVRSRSEASALVLDPKMWARLGMAVTGAGASSAGFDEAH